MHVYIEYACTLYRHADAHTPTLIQLHNTTFLQNNKSILGANIHIPVLGMLTFFAN